jgi:hypothetical protein
MYPYMLEIEVKDVNRLAHSIGIIVDQNNHKGWNEIDSVKLPGKPKWSSYSCIIFVLINSNNIWFFSPALKVDKCSANWAVVIDDKTD